MYVLLQSRGLRSEYRFNTELSFADDRGAIFVPMLHLLCDYRETTLIMIIITCNIST